MPKMIAPRLYSGIPRNSIGHCLPPDIKEGLKAIARKENQSISWVLEQVIIEYFDLRRPRYVERKGNGRV
jgi:predicted transcriptional regulator